MSGPRRLVPTAVTREAAFAAIELSGQLTAAEDVINDVITHAVRARLALADGDNAAAERWARSAVEYARRTDFIRHTAQARLNLARILAALACPREAADEARRAMERCEAKGDHPGVAEAAELLDSPALRRVCSLFRRAQLAGAALSRRWRSVSPPP